MSRYPWLATAELSCIAGSWTPQWKVLKVRSHNLDASSLMLDVCSVFIRLVWVAQIGAQSLKEWEREGYDEATVNKCLKRLRYLLEEWSSDEA